MKINIPDKVHSIMSALSGAGFDSYVVGGCVRDSIMGRVPSDWDITTAATPEQVRDALCHYRVIETGMKHGTVTAIAGDTPVEITTFRVDGEYEDSRHPTEVFYTTEIESDLSRRDFTINAMAYNRERGIIDLFGGMADIENKLIRAVGEPNKRLSEDALRILRALRFSAVLGFDIEEQTERSIVANCELIKNISSERIRAELTKLVCGDFVHDVLLNNSLIISQILPEIIPSIGFDQNNYHHIYDVWEHTVKSVEAIAPDPTLRLVMLFHDLGKPQSYTQDMEGVGHFYGHPLISTSMAGGALMRLRFDNATIKKVCTLVEYHDSHLFPTEKSVKRWLMRIGEENLRLLIQVKRADNLAQSPQWRGRQQELTATESVLKKIIEENICFSLAQLEIDGNDLMELGVPGVIIGRLLNMLLSEVVNENCPNNKEKLISEAELLLKSLR